jgi:hypothetical protein
MGRKTNLEFTKSFEELRRFTIKNLSYIRRESMEFRKKFRLEKVKHKNDVV